jgi:hypothetical protein
MNEMRRSIQTGAQPRGFANRRKHGRSRAFAVCTGDMNSRILALRLTEKFAQLFNPFQSQLPTEKAEGVEEVLRGKGQM